MVQIKQITKDALRRMEPAEGLILQGCGGDLTEWVDGINDLLTQEGILLSGTKFQSCATFSHKGVTCLLFPFSAEAKTLCQRVSASGSYEEALSYNDCPEIRGLYEGYHFFDFTRIHSMVQKYEAGKEFPELLVANYDLFERERAKPRQMSLFDNEEPTSWKEEILT